jgi:hypothetical protein
MSHDPRPRVSVLIAARDAQQTLPAALRSVARQRFSSWECIIVDDGSKDQTAEVIQDFATQDARFSLVTTDGVGVIAARNLGLAQCRGELIALLDADDLMHRDRLALQEQALEQHPEWSGVGSWVRYFPRRKVRDGRLAYEYWLNQPRSPQQIAQERFLEMPLGHPTLLLRQEVLRQQAWQDVDWPEDWDLLLRLIDDGHVFGVLPKVLHSWRLDAQSLSQQSSAYTQESFTRCRASFLTAGPLHEHERYHLLGYGRTGKQLRRALEKHHKRCHTIVEVHPARIGQVIDHAPVIALEDLGQLDPTLPLLCSVANSEARVVIRQALRQAGRCEGTDAWFVA